MSQLQHTLGPFSSDIVQIIIHAICDVRDQPDPSQRRSPWKNLLSLSLVSKHLRSECLPHLFRQWTYTIRESKLLIPEHLWCHIKQLRINDPGPSYRAQADQYLASAERLWMAFSRMPAVTACTYTGRPTIQSDFVRALVMLPSLIVLELVDTIFPEFDDLGLSDVSGLARLVFRAGAYMRIEYPASKYSRIEAYHLFTLMQGSNTTLEHIELPGGSYRLADMAKLHWPSLRTLILYDEAPDVPLIHLLQHAPSLIVLDVQVKREEEDPQYMIYPGGLISGVEMPKIRSLTLTNPSPDDGIFRFLSDVRFLSLAVLPPAYSVAEGVNLLHVPIWEAGQAAEVLLYSEMGNLVELRISVQGEGFKDLVDCISRNFPLLNTLEIHHYPTQLPRLILPFDLPFISLARLTRLVELRLDLNVLTLGAFPVENPTDEYFEADEKRALYVAESLPQLKVIGTLYRLLYPQPVVSAFWNIYHVSRSEQGVQIELQPIAYRNYPFYA